MNKGWLKLYRKLINSPVFQDECLLKLWILCLCKATHKKTHVKAGGIVQPVHLKPGQFITGRYNLHGDYHQWRRGYKKRFPSPKTAWRWLQTLQSMQKLTIKSFNKFSIITISNWDRYQQIDHQATNRRPTDDHKQECIKNVKEISCGKLEVLKSLLVSLPEFCDLPEDTKRLITDFINRARESNKTKKITGNRVSKILADLIAISGETSTEHLNAALEKTIERASAGQFTFGKQNVTGYAKAIARNRHQREQEEQVKKYEPEVTDTSALYGR